MRNWRVVFWEFLNNTKKQHERVYIWFRHDEQFSLALSTRSDYGCIICIFIQVPSHSHRIGTTVVELFTLTQGHMLNYMTKEKLFIKQYVRSPTLSQRFAIQSFLSSLYYKVIVLIDRPISSRLIKMLLADQL